MIFFNIFIYIYINSTFEHDFILFRYYIHNTMHIYIYDNMYDEKNINAYKNIIKRKEITFLGNVMRKKILHIFPLEKTKNGKHKNG